MWNSDSYGPKSRIGMKDVPWECRGFRALRPGLTIWTKNIVWSRSTLRQQGNKGREGITFFLKVMFLSIIFHSDFKHSGNPFSPNARVSYFVKELPIYYQRLYQWSVSIYYWFLWMTNIGNLSSFLSFYCNKMEIYWRYTWLLKCSLD